VQPIKEWLRRLATSADRFIVFMAGNSGRTSVTVTQRAAQTFTAVNGTCIRGVARFRLKDSVV
jgi:Ser/Thr protein kinase RdoA (MazF antagonist)